MNKQKGFTLVEGLLIVLILSVVGFAGYTVWINQQDEPTATDISNNENTQAQETEEAKKQEATDIPEGWTKYESDFGFSIAYPNDYAPSESIMTPDNQGGLGDPVVFRITNPSAEDKTAYDGDSLYMWNSVGGVPDGYEFNTASSLRELVSLNRKLNVEDTNPNVDITVGDIQELSVSNGQAYFFEVNGAYNYIFNSGDISGWVID